ncbi:MAG: hypothetical protein OXJ52_07730 [Oligoflexia bacterium]|nr:hypothetical protein [Oligoflexia bacterium]
MIEYLAFEMQFNQRREKHRILGIIDLIPKNLKALWFFFSKENCSNYFKLLPFSVS